MRRNDCPIFLSIFSVANFYFKFLIAGFKILSKEEWFKSKHIRQVQVKHKISDYYNVGDWQVINCYEKMSFIFSYEKRSFIFLIVIGGISIKIIG